MAVRNVDDHGPESGRRDDDGHLRCDACGFRWPCPDVRAAGASFTPNQIALLEMVEPGWTVYERTPDDANHVGRGGIVIGFYDDPEAEERVYRVVETVAGRPREFTLPASVLDPRACGLPNSSYLRPMARRLAAEFAKGKGAIGAHELHNLELAFTLARSIA